MPKRAPVQTSFLQVAKLAQMAVVGVIRFYQLMISPLKRPSCRFYPSCSQYCLEAVRRYGVFKGGAMGLRRILRCHPYHPGGYNPVE